MSNINKIDNNGNNNNNPTKDGRLSLEAIDVPFPLTGQLATIIASYKERTISGKPPNGFILYRKALVRELNAHGYYLPAKDISPLASEKWKNKPEIVKEEYRQISSNIGKIFQKAEPPVILTPENFCTQSTIKMGRKNVRGEAATRTFKMTNKLVSKIDTDIVAEHFDGSQKSDSEPATPLSKDEDENENTEIKKFFEHLYSTENSMNNSNNIFFEHAPEYNLPSVKQEINCADNFDYIRNCGIALEVGSPFLEPVANCFLESYNSYSQPIMINESPADLLLSLMDRESEVYFEKSNWIGLFPERETECFNNYINADSFVPNLSLPLV
ncbi:208_t:CDS:1 [Ambispora gerdemannii]|uniref:208_t:CDS:1 n=1 Tax=Ambispora gerdemannii TaxID=144530 RepID=A0A9N8W2B8_9GLOM|nr:208_t:CDS:1 [Ambispora gerdemannii]